MSARPRDPRRLDLRGFAADAAMLQGHVPQADLPRFASSLMPALADTPSPDVAWTARGESRRVTGGAPQVWLHLAASTQVRLECQRCLQPVLEALSFDRRLRFVDGEAEAARLDEELDDDVLALPPRADLQTLIEDELILALPIVPRHEVCPQPLAFAAVDLPAGGAAAGSKPPGHDAGGGRGDAGPGAPHPFAALAALRSKRRDDDG